jgi:sugar phosphate isomerase/epimerase
MSIFSRRGFLNSIAVMATPSFGRTLKTIGVQLYTLRTVLHQQPLETLRELEKIGYREAEVVGDNIEAIWPSLKQTALRPVSVHLNTSLFTTEQAKLPTALENAKKRGLEYAVCPYIAPKDRGGVEVIKKLGETLNKAGEMCSKSGLKLCYHNHAFEFEREGNATLLDVLLQTTDPKLVGLELDIMWAQAAGVDPVSVLKKYGRRVQLMHLKNIGEGVGPQFHEKVPKEAFREVGKGVIKIPAVLKAAAEAGVEHYFVEQDQTPGDPLASLRDSFQYLEKLNY